MAFSEKQRQIMRFPYTDYDALICDGAVRSGKTTIMSLSFFLWAMGNFNNCAFAFCGKSVGAVERNIVVPLLSVVYLKRNFDIRYNRGDHVIVARRGNRENRVYLFGGKDESSYTLVQGVTLAGVLLDEVALMPRSFVEQALARCSVKGSKLWFNCNPENPQHWFRQEWILQPEKHNALHLHFLMDDNPSLDEETKARYRSMYSGLFYERYILGRWVMSEGLIYDMFDPTENVYREDIPSLPYSCQRYIACDYGTTNPTVFLDIYDDGERIRVDREYRWDSRKERRQKTDQEYADDFLEFMGGTDATVLVDPSAASFIVALRQRGVYVREADNDVLDGIRKTGVLLNRREILIHEQCSGLIDELGTYLWDEKASLRGEEKPVKQRDHGPDALRYPQFFNKEGNFLGSLPMLEEIIRMANVSIQPDRWLDGWRYAVGLCVAHYVTLSLRGYAASNETPEQAAASGALVGVVKSATLGDASVQYDTTALTAGTEDWGDLNSTTYGQILANRAKLIGMGGTMVL